MRFTIPSNLVMRRADGDAVPLPRLKHRQLPAALLLRAGAPVSADDLTKALWDGTPDDGEAACHHFERALDLWHGEAIQNARIGQAGPGRPGRPRDRRVLPRRAALRQPARGTAGTRQPREAAAF
ncbi:hypothetical protein Pta02_38590 [Planobispora takensis]|uniref:OmpR/PhoB-type domain-containing protein n=1 Tax=Planobispora takensis TaxID=1367882 RepID=A0A8J3SY19_9ACTN|nr:hypothetical protein Pta02_38590 [Planobispora takensis]